MKLTASMKEIKILIGKKQDGVEHGLGFDLVDTPLLGAIGIIITVRYDLLVAKT